MIRTTAVITIAAIFALGLTACGGEPAPKHATLKDCAADYSGSGRSPEELATFCARVLNKMGQSKFDKIYG